MNAKELSEALSKRALEVATYLFPNGKRAGAEYTVGSIDGGKGSSLSICIRGQKAGVWKDFADDIGGDLIDLWRMSKGCTLKQAISQCHEFLGESNERITEAPFIKKYAPVKLPVLSAEEDSVFTWLRSERNLSRAAIEAYRVKSSGGTHAAFPSFKNGKLANYKLRSILNKKDMRTSAGAEQVLFGWQAIPEDQRYIIICEGELDAMSLFDYGYPSLSAFSGAQNLSWLDNDYQELDRFTEIYICFDNDEAGRKGAAKLAERLGRERCMTIVLPLKDANDCLVAGMPKDEIDAAFNNAKHVGYSEIRKPSDFIGEVQDYFCPKDGELDGCEMPWESASEIRLRESELSIWSGYSGHGKSQLLGQVLLHAAEHGERIVIASFEMKAKFTLARMVRQATGKANPTRDEVARAMAFINEYFWIYDIVGSVNTADVISRFTYCRQRFGVSHFVIDNLMMLDATADDMDKQTQTIKLLMGFKSQFDCHLHLVAHARKGVHGEDKPPRKMDISGSSNIVNLADNVFIIWRNLPKEAGKAGDGEGDAIMICDKQRNGEWEGSVNLWYTPKSKQYFDNQSRSEGGMPIKSLRLMTNDYEASR